MKTWFAIALLLAAPAYALPEDECAQINKLLETDMPSLVSCIQDSDCAWIPNAGCPWSACGGRFIASEKQSIVENELKAFAEGCLEVQPFKDNYESCMEDTKVIDCISPRDVTAVCREGTCDIQLLAERQGALE